MYNILELDWGSKVLAKIDLIDPKTIKDNEYDEDGGNIQKSK